MMDSHRTPAPKLDAIPLPSLRTFLLSNGYLHREQWGSYLDRFSRKIGGREDNILVPTERDLVDFDKRMLDAVEALSKQLKTAVPVLLKQVVNSGFEIVRIKANEGQAESTLAYDAAIDLLRGGFALIDSSAVVAVSDHNLRIIRGRRPDIVRRYLDGVRVGQTEVGSFVLTLLMPIAADGNALELPQEIAGDFGSRVADRMSAALSAAESAVRSGQPTVGSLTSHGVTANFTGGLARIVEAVGDVTVGVMPATVPQKRSRLISGKFRHEDARTLRQIEHSLTPTEQRQPLSIQGTVTNISEPRGKVSGTVILKTEVYGEDRPVRIHYTRAQREVVMEALQQKSHLFLSVSGILTSRGGHHRLEEPHDFRLVP